jgi:hypothetical protein
MKNLEELLSNTLLKIVLRDLSKEALQMQSDLLSLLRR